MEIKIGSKNIGNKNPIYFIAEIGVNHSGNIDLAKKMVIAAKESGANAVKFQTFSAGLSRLSMNLSVITIFFCFTILNQHLSYKLLDSSMQDSDLRVDKYFCCVPTRWSPCVR